MELSEKRFKQRIRDFQKSVWVARKFVEPDNETEVVQKLIESVVSQVADIKQSQLDLEAKIDRMANMFEMSNRNNSYLEND